jgi:hypothetical protein
MDWLKSSIGVLKTPCGREQRVQTGVTTYPGCFWASGQPGEKAQSFLQLKQCTGLNQSFLDNSWPARNCLLLHSWMICKEFCLAGQYYPIHTIPHQHLSSYLKSCYSPNTCW